jgi:predicted dehydrogenase
MSEPLILGLIGAGRVGDRWAHQLLGRPDARLAFVHDVSAEKAAGLAGRFGAQVCASAEALIEQAQAVLVATVPSAHGQIALSAIARGKPTLIESPYACSRAEAMAVSQAASAANVVCLAARSMHDALLSAGLADAREKLLTFESVREETATGRAADVSVTLDLMLDDLEHAIAAYAAPPVAVRASVLAGRSDRPDAVSAVLRFRGGGEARLRASRAGSGRVRRLQFAYPSGVVAADLIERTVDSAVPWTLDLDRLTREETDAGLDRFIAAARAGAPPPQNVRAREALDVALQIDAICRAQAYT